MLKDCGLIFAGFALAVLLRWAWDRFWNEGG